MKRLFLPLLLLCLAACNTQPKADYVTDPANYVDPFIGTGGHGHTFPGATVPFGMVQFSPDTRMNDWDARLLLALQGQPRPMAFLLWGKGAQTKGQAARIMDSPYPRLIIETAHPSPLSARRGFFGSKPFSRVNQFLEEHGETPICWAVER